jgi:hypothetical protein
MTASGGMAAVELQRGCDPHRRGFDNSEKAMTCTQSPCFPEVTTTLALLAEDRRGQRQAAAVGADMRHDGPTKLPWAAGRHEPFRGLGPLPRPGLPSQPVTKMEASALGHPGQNARPAAGAPNAAKQGVCAVKGPFVGN